jgi:low affinity Fe/Cu permease
VRGSQDFPPDGSFCTLGAKLIAGWRFESAETSSEGLNNLESHRLLRSLEIRSMAARKSHWTTTIGQATGHPAAFLVVLLYTAAWLIFDRDHFDMHGVATLFVWLMTLFIERSNRRDTLALHAKLDELLRANSNARSELMRLDEEEPEQIAEHRDEESKKAGAPA